MLDEGEIRSSVVVFGRRFPLARGPRSKTGLHQLGDGRGHVHRATASLIQCADAIHTQALSHSAAP